jgi:hypothetical protein
MPASPRASLSPDAQLLLLSARVSPSDVSLRRALSAGINWENLVGLARDERAAPVLMRQIGRIGAGAENPQYRELRQLATISAMEMLQLEQLLYETMDLLAQHEIEAVLLKGAGLAFTAYSSFADRPMGDLDLLVSPRDAERAWSLLHDLGWSPRPRDGDPAGYATHHHLAPLCRESERFRLEIHTQILPREHPFRFFTDAIWLGAQRITVNRRVMKVPSPLHQLWHACVHFAWSHGLQWGAWRALRDGAAIIERAKFDWTAFVSLAQETRAATCCFWSLRLTRRLTGAAVPDDVLNSLHPPYPEFIVECLERHFVASLFPSENRCPSVWLTRRLWETAISPRWSKHGGARPWHVTERWEAASKGPGVKQAVGRSVIDLVRKIGAGRAYISGLGRFSLPMNSA